ncbi:hypothetical protein [Denitratisoma oestradiolicum]|uniref:Phosphate ABC transporter substrate-binding protein n=1 Tax=Denitratisoma oestradiolicum TaxID=311182 RepID=A0A6S6Y266_9PROT|nr:hypothetical protein [Denitratisoma oestradiolicum]TWO79042.1 hypothetical protein CBW56_16825 [Denitratisoma oestradiolicum]CAB1369413.1 conserved protein of unknown function [Denitratisoma oestradiolicum]
MLFLLLLILSWAATGGELLLVAHRDLPAVSLSREDVADLFLGKRRIYAGALVLSPMDVANEGLREGFYQAVAGFSSNRVRGYWAQQVFTGRSRPPREVGPAEAGEIIVKEKGVVTYLPVVPAGARILLRLSVP